MCHNNPPVRNAIIGALKEHGPMTCSQLAEYLDWPLERVQSSIKNARHLRPGLLFRVVGYRPAVDTRGKDASVYAAEAGADMPRIKPRAASLSNRAKANRARWRDKNRAQINAKARSIRQKQAGYQLLASPWDVIAPPSVRSVITQITMSQSRRQQP